MAGDVSRSGPTPQVSKPIIIIGTGRCGSTLLHRLLAKHPRVMWLSNVCNRFPDRPTWNRWAVEADASPLLSSLLGGRILPSEAYRFWDRYAFGFSRPCRDLGREDVMPRAKRQVRAVLAQMLTPKRDRLLIKLAGWPRIGYLQEIFADAKFIHIARDGRAVASSLLHVDFWRGWEGPQNWGAGLLTPEDQAVWESYDRSFVALAGLQWKIRSRAMEAARRTVDPSAFLEIKYEALCAAPLETCRRLLEFAELPPSPEFDRHVEATRIRDSASRWRDDLTPVQQAILTEVLREDLLRLGYDASSKGSDSSAPVAQVPA